MQAKTLCFTGHRPKDMFGYQSKPYEIMRRYLKDIVLYFYENKDVRTFITGGAQGVDQIAFFAISDAKKERADIQNVLYLPCINQDSQWAELGPFSKEEYQKMLSLADKVVYISEQSYQFPKQMLDRDEAMVENSDYVIGVLQKGETFQNMPRSGAASTMRYAEKTRKTLYRISYEKDKTEFTDFTAKKISSPKEAKFKFHKPIYTGYFAKLDEYKEMGLHPISIARVTPKNILCDKAGIFAPPSELLSDFKNNPELPEEEYEKRYKSHLSSIDLIKELNNLPDLTEKETGYVFLCYEAPNEFCHRHLLADFLNQKYSVNVKEYDIPIEKEKEEEIQNEL